MMFWWKKPKTNRTDNTPKKQPSQSRLTEVYQDLALMQEKAEDRAEIQKPDYEQKRIKEREKWSREESLALLQVYITHFLKAEGVPASQNPVQIDGLWFGAEEEEDAGGDIIFLVHLYRPCRRCGELTPVLRLGPSFSTNLWPITSYLHRVEEGNAPEPICKKCRMRSA